MIIFNVPESLAEKANNFITKGLKVEIISDEEYIKRFGVESLIRAKNMEV